MSSSEEVRRISHTGKGGPTSLKDIKKRLMEWFDNLKSGRLGLISRRMRYRST